MFFVAVFVVVFPCFQLAVLIWPWICKGTKKELFSYVGSFAPYPPWFVLGFLTSFRNKFNECFIIFYHILSMFKIEPSVTKIIGIHIFPDYKYRCIQGLEG